MTEKYIPYKVNGDTYHIPESMSEGFEKKYPSATIEMHVGDDVYDIPLEHKSGFLKKYANASYLFDEKQKERQPAEEVSIVENNPQKDNLSNILTSVNDSLMRAQLGANKTFADQQMEKVTAPDPEIDRDMADLVIESHRGNKTRVDEYLAEQDKTGYDYDPTKMGGSIPMPAMGLAHNMYLQSKKAQKTKGQDYTDALVAQRLQGKVEDKVEQYLDPSKTFLGGAKEGFKDTAFDLDTWDSGMAAEDAARIYAISKKLDKGDKLTDGEDMIIDALVDDLASDVYLAAGFGRGYKAGQVTGESLPFMVETMLNPASKFGESITKKFGKEIFKRVGKRLGAKAARAAVHGTRVLSDIAGAAMMSATTSQARVAEDALNRLGGQVDFEINEDGTLGFKGFVGGEDSAFKAYAKAYGANTIEHFSEMVGNYFAPMGQMAKDGTAALANKVGLKRVGELLTEMTPNGFGSLVNDFAEQTQWHGMIGEFAEEMVSGAMNALVVGDQTLKKYDENGNLNENYLFDKDNMIDTFLGVAILGGVMSTAKTLGYTTPETRYNREISKAKKALDGKLTDNEIKQLEAFASNPLGMGYANLRPFFEEGRSDESKKAVATYLKAVMEKQGYNISRQADLSGTQQGMNEMRTAWTLGENMSEADLYDIEDALAQAIQEANDTGLLWTPEEVMSRSSYDLLNLSNHSNYTPEQSEAVKNLALIRNAKEGLENRLNAIAQADVDIYTRIANDTATNGVITTGSYNGRMVYVKGGVNVKNGRIVNPSPASGHPVEVVDAITGETTIVESKDVTGVDNFKTEDIANGISNTINTSYQQRWDSWRNTKSIKSKLAEIQNFVGEKVYIKTANNDMAEVEVQQILPNGEVLIKGKKGDLGGQSTIRVDVDSFYDSMSRDANGNPIFNQSEFRSQTQRIADAQNRMYVQGEKARDARQPNQQEQAPVAEQTIEQESPQAETPQEQAPEAEVSQEPVGPTEEADFRDFAGTIIINGKPIQVDEITAQDNVSDSITYRYTDENGVQRTGNTTIGAFAEAVNLGRQQTETPAPEPTIETPEPMPAEPVAPVEPSPMPEPQPAPAENIELEPESINWDALFEQDKEAYFAELQKQYGEETLDVLNEEIQAAQEELDELGKKRGKDQNERLENRKKKAALQNRIDVLNGMVARLSATPEVPAEATPVAEQTPVVPATPAEQTPVAEAPEATQEPVSDEPIGKTPQTPTEPSPIPAEPEPTPEATATETPVQTEPEPIAEPIPSPEPTAKPKGGAIARMISSAKGQIAKLASKANIKDFTVDDNARPVFGGVLRKGGYEYASDSHVLAKIKASYPVEQEEKIYSVKTGQEISGRFPNADLVISSSENVNTKIDADIDDILATAQAAEELKKGFDKSKKIYVRVGRSIFDSSYLLKAARMAKHQGLTTISQHPTEDRAMLFAGNNGVVLIMPIKPGKADVIDSANGEATFDDYSLLSIKTPSSLKGIETARGTIEAILPNLSEASIDNLKNSDSIKLVDGKVYYNFLLSDIVNAKNKAKDPNTYAALEDIEKNGLEIPLSASEIAKVFPETAIPATPTTPVTSVANPIDEARKKERQLALNLKKVGLSPEQKQDLAYNAGKAVADMFPTMEAYDAYAETAADFGAYNADFERGVEDSFAARNQQNTGNPPVNSVPLESEPNGEDNGEATETTEGTDSGQGDSGSVRQAADEGGQEVHQGTSETEPKQGKDKGRSKTKQVASKYPARKGNATQKLLIDTFGFESVKIPNTRKGTLNAIYDFMMEMSKMLGISPNVIGQGGMLGVGSLNARARATAEHSLHRKKFSFDFIDASINFKYAQLEGIAHEWWHALDYALGYFDSGKVWGTATEVSDRQFAGRKETLDAVRAVIQAIKDSGYPERIKSLTTSRAALSYYLDPTEMAARAFDGYLRDMFAAAGISIEGASYDYIDTDPSQQTPEEMAVITPAFDNLFKVLQEKEGKKPGTSILYHIGEMMEPQSDSKKFATESILTALDDGNREVVIMDDEQTKQYLKAIGADTDTQFSIDTDKPIFLSNAAIAVMGIKQEKATPEQWLKMIEKAGGLKAGEDKWMGLSDWLKAQDAKTLTKQEVLDFINENTIRIEEVGYKQWDALDYIDEAVKILEAEMREIGWDAMVEKYPRFDELFEEYNGELMWSETRASVAEYEQFIFDEHNLLERPINDTRENYTTDGLDNKKEIAIIVPTIESWNKSDVIHFGDAGDGRAVAWVRFGDARTYAKEFADFYDFQGKMQKKYFPDRVIQALGGSDLDALTEEERAEFERLREIARSIPAKDRTNRRVLVIDEIQSKRHQDAREQGGNRVADIDGWLSENNVEVKETGEFYEFYKNGSLDRRFSKGLLNYNIESAKSLYVSGYQKSNVPDAPFDKNWSELAMKRMLRYAAENGYDAVAWTKGEQQAERYNISKSVDNIDAEDSIIEEFEDGTPVAKFIHLDLASGESVPLRVDADGNVRGGRFHGNNLSDIIGKELAVKVMQPGNIRLSGEGLRVGGEGMKGFYDKMLPAFMNKYGKKWGVKVSDITLPHVEQSGRVMHSVPVNEAMKNSVMEGQPMFYKTPNGTVYGWTDGKKIYLTKAGINPNTPIHEYTHLWAKAMMLRNPKGWESIKKLLKGTPVWNEVMNDANYSNIHGDEDLVASEALSRISGSENAAKMEQMAQQMIDEAKGTGRKLEARGLIQNMRDALNKFWNWVGTNLFGIENFDSVEQVTDRVLYDLLNKTDLGELSEGQVETQIVTDPKVIAELEASPKRTGYRNVVQNEDGTFSSPMAYWLQSKKGGAKTRVETAKFELGKWEEAEEHPELVDEKGHVVLVKPNKNTVEVAYDPYIHNRLDPVNLQFKDAWKRDELVYVETEVPETDLESGYHADEALLSVGVHSWSNGALMLSKYDKPVRIMPWEDVADAWVARLNGEGVEFDVVPPALRPLLVERGVEILPPHKGMGKDCNDAYKEWKDKDTLSRDGDIVGFSESKDEFDIKVREAAKSVGIVREGLNSLLFSITNVDMHDFEGEHPADLARAWARKNLVTTKKDKENGTLPRMIDDTPYEISGNAINKYLSGKALQKSNDFDAHLSVLKELKNVIANSVDVEIHPDYIKEDGSRTTNKYGDNVLIHRLYGAISIDGRIYRVKTTMQEFRGNESNRPHSYEVTKIELLDSSMAAGDSATVNGEPNPNNSISATKLLNGVEKSYDKGKYLLAESKDIVSYSDTQNAAVDYLAGPQRNEVIQRAVNEEAAKLGVSVTYATREDMPKGKKNDKGYFNTETGEIVICTENNASIADAIQTILHEAVAHKGLRQLMGDKFNEFINRVYDSLDSETKAKVDALAESKYDGNTAVAMEEYMASLAETENFAENSVWDKIKSAFENIINAILGRNDIKIGDNELRYILRASYNNMVNPRNMDSIRGWAQDQMMREDYKINHVAPELLSRTGIDPTEVATQTASLVYDQVVSDRWQEFQRQFQDAMQPVRIAIDAIQQETGNIPIEDYENYLLIQNQSSSRSRVEIDDFARRYYSPVIEQVNKIIDTILESRGYKKNDEVKRSEVYKEVKTYLIAKHGLERNKYYQSTKTRRMDKDEKKPELDQAKQDYNDKVNQINADTTLTDAERQLQLRDALDEYNATVQEIETREVPDIRDYSGLTALFATEDLDEAEQLAQEAVDNFENAVATDELWAKINAATDKTLRHSYESGLLSRQQYNDIKDMFDFYIPLRGFDESTAEDVYAYARFEGNRFNPAVHKAKGRTSLADDPIAIIMNMAESEIAQGNKNRAKQALYNFLLNRPVTDADGNQHQNSLMQIESVWYIKTTDAHGNETYQLATPDRSIGETYEEFENRMMADPNAIKSKKGQVDVGMRFQKQSHKDAHYVYLKVNGVEKAIYINGNPKAADAINGTYAPLPSEAMQKVKDVQRLVSSTFTNYSLEFTARNYFRDMVYSHINIGVRESDPAYRKKFRQNWRHNNMGTMLKMLKAYRAGEYDGRPLNEDEAAFVDFMNNGGQTGYTLINSVEAHKKDLERAIEHMQKGIVKGGVKDSTIFRYTLGGVELLNEASELVTRFAAFKTSRDMGRGINRSINDAKEVTVNFNTKGAQDGNGWMGIVARYLGAVKYFFNASVQGVQNLYKAFQTNKLKFGFVVGGTIGLGMMMPILQGALSELIGGDEDEYWNIPEYDRQNNLCFVIGKGKYVKLPLPIGFREMYGLGDLMMAGILDKKFTRSPLSVGMDVANKIATVVLPINPLEGSANGLSLIESGQDMLLPDFTQGMVQNRTNTDFKGVPIQKEYTYNENNPQWTKAFANNPSWLTGLSKWCYEHIAIDGEGWDWSPEKLDNTLSNAFGGIYSLLKKTGRSVSAIWNEDNRTLSNVPLVGVIVGSNADDDQRFVNSTYWEMDEYYNKRLYKIKSTAENFGLTLDEVFARNLEGERAGEHQPAMNKIYNSDYFDFMQEWYLGHKGEGEVDENGNKILGLSQIKNKIKNLETKIKKNEGGVATPEQDEELVELNNLYEATRRDLVNDLLELD